MQERLARVAMGSTPKDLARQRPIRFRIRPRVCAARPVAPFAFPEPLPGIRARSGVTASAWSGEGERWFRWGSDSGRRDQVEQVLLAKTGCSLRSREEFIRKFPLFPVQFHDLLLDGSPDDQAVDGHGPLLPDAVRPVRSLVLDSGIPPRVKVNDVVRRGEIEAGTTGLEADQEQISLTRLKRSDPLLALRWRRGPVEILVSDVC